jgi:hypothetical protein
MDLRSLIREQNLRANYLRSSFRISDANPVNHLFARTCTPDRYKPFICIHIVKQVRGGVSPS